MKTRTAPETRYAILLTRQETIQLLRLLFLTEIEHPDLKALIRHLERSIADSTANQAIGRN